MSREKKRKKESPGPSASAGLLSFYGEITDSIIKIRPEIVLFISVALIIGVVLGHIFITLP